MAATDYAKNIKQESQEWITLALLTLLEHKKLTAITVSEVAKKAGVSRMAFYRHFTDLPQVLQSYYEPKFQVIFDKTLHKISHQQKLLDLTDFFQELTPAFQNAITGEYEYLLLDIFSREMAKFYDATTTWSDWRGYKREYWIKFMSAGLFEVWRTWIKTGQKENLAEMTDLIREFHQ